MGDLISSWRSGDRTFVAHRASISGQENACVMLLEAPVISLLPEPLNTPPPGPVEPFFAIRDAGVKGAGMFATRDIPAGALILVDHPVAIVPADFPGPCKLDAFEALPSRLSEAFRDSLLALANCKPLSEHPVVEGIALTNAIQIELPSPPAINSKAIEYGGLFPNLSRANHSCGLNTAVKWDLASFSVSMYSLRDVRAGEELYNQYIDVLAPRATRRAQLAPYDFTCACIHCNLDDEAAVARSDAVRAELRNWRNLHPRFEPWSMDICRADDAIIVSNLRALELIEQEGLYGLQVPFIEEIALSYAMLGDEDQFRMWAQKLVTLCAGQDPARATKFAGWIANPASYKKWGWRTKQRQFLDKQQQTGQTGIPDIVDVSIPW
ncbi:hypothetical protein C8J57DRAFT_1282543 [Mycena rebaudengoi]|nr:hypothetical protein C8J57DRAFT_1282543 [Mycena rebaudengoi]